MTIDTLIAVLESLIPDAKVGLPEAVFLFISRHTPMVNVDLLIKNSQNQTLLTWRQDWFHGPAWHVPGGIIRFKETAAQRIQKVAETELGAQVEFGATPLAVTEMFAPDRDTRGHFISLLYECRLVSAPDPQRAHTGGTLKHGNWAWHDTCPDALIKPHQVYRNHIGNNAPGRR